MESRQYMQSQSSHIPMAVTGILIMFSVVSRSSISILMPAWLDVLKNITENTNSCHINSSNNQIDAYTIIFIYVVLCLMFFAFVLLVAKIWCSELVTQRESSYDKRKFALIGASDAIATLCFVYASSRCRTAPYLQAIATNLALPVTFIIRFLALRKRPTCRKTLCALLVLFASITAQIPDIVPQLEGLNAKNVGGEADGIEGILWSLCLFFGFIPMALVYVVMENVMKSSAHSNNRRYMDALGYINIAYVLFWTYLFQLLTLILLFWTDIIPEVGMRNGVVDFVNGFWFNVQCFFGQEGCQRTVIVISSVCTVMLFMNKLVSSYFLRYLEGANYLVMITSIQTPVVLLFFSLFDKTSIVWHPHAYLSTWLGVAALCIMLPAIYIYDTGAPESQPKSEPLQTVSEIEVQTDESGPRSQQTQTEPATQISYNVQSHRVAIPNYMDDDVLMPYFVQAHVGAATALVDNTTLIPCRGLTPAGMEYVNMVPYDRLDLNVYAPPTYTASMNTDDTTPLITF